MGADELRETKNRIDYIIADLALYLIRDEGISVNEALGMVYDSEYYNLLNDLDTELYLRGCSTTIITCAVNWIPPKLSSPENFSY